MRELLEQIASLKELVESMISVSETVEEYQVLNTVQELLDAAAKEVSQALILSRVIEPPHGVEE